MSGIKGMNHYPETIKNEIRQAYHEGQSVKSLSKIYGISRYAIQSWCGLRPETRIRQIAPLPKGRPKAIKSIDDYRKENKRLKMVSDAICFCFANKREDTDWVHLPVENFDCYYSNTNFSKKWLSKIPDTILEREVASGICRVKLKI